jgi:RNA polymerase sigma-70 factor (ECF subfamily)
LSGDHDFDAIWREAGPAIWRAVLVYAGGRRAIADDAVAEAFARAIERAGSIRDPIPYLYRVSFRVAADDLKRASHFAEPEDRATTDIVEDIDMLDALKGLSPAQRGAVYLYYRADLPVRDVARMLGTSSAVVRVHLMRGRRRLAELLGDER